jgi:hypothetical protein
MDVRLKRAYWQLTSLAMAAHFGGWEPGLSAAIVITAGQTTHFVVEGRDPRAFEVQVRGAFLALLLLGLVPPLWPIHAAQFVGINLRLVTDYCPLARMLALAPWNRTVPLSWSLARWLMLSPPAPGSILDRMPRDFRTAGGGAAPPA